MWKNCSPNARVLTWARCPKVRSPALNLTALLRLAPPGLDKEGRLRFELVQLTALDMGSLVLEDVAP